MNWFTRSRHIRLALLAALVLALALSACGSPANAANPGVSGNKPVNTQTQQYQPSSSGSVNSATNADQQIQSLVRQLDGAHNDVNNADNGATQDGGQP